jgi:hypothetical protein
MNFAEVMTELEALGKERTKKIYMSNGAVEPLFGVATGAMKPLRKIIKINQPLKRRSFMKHPNYFQLQIKRERQDAHALFECFRNE